MLRICALRNPIQPYAWGSHTALAEFLGERGPSAEPQAELWIGAHPRASSEVRLEGRWQPLHECIARNPERLLGAGIVRRFGPRLPFLLKVLAVERPLSIQAHPDLDGAREGFAREDALGIPLDASHRSYRDVNHKPELVCALEAFRVLKGFRPAREVAELLEPLAAPSLAAMLGPLCADPGPRTLRDFFAALLRLTAAARRRLVAEVVAAAAARHDEQRAYGWLVDLAEVYPEDPGVLGALLLNDVLLEPGQALFLPARELHCYISGLAVELMANSDNVLRGGLTAKHVDVEELLRSVDFGPGCAEPLAPDLRVPGERTYPTPAAEFELSALELRSGFSLPSASGHGAEILLCSAGAVTIAPREAGPALELPRGAAAFVPACAGEYELCGEGVVYRARAPEASPSAPRPGSRDAEKAI